MAGAGGEGGVGENTAVLLSDVGGGRPSPGQVWPSTTSATSKSQKEVLTGFADLAKPPKQSRGAHVRWKNP